MDFDLAAKRLAKDQSKLKGRSRAGRIEVSAKAKREAELRKKHQERLAAEKRKRQEQEDYWRQYIRQRDRALGVKSLSRSGGDSLLLSATSIHGEGDKIALPPSILEFLTADLGTDDGGTNNMSGHDGSPWTFRIGILNQDYRFPESSTLKAMTVPKDASMQDGEDDDDDDSDMDEDDGSDEVADAAYLEELNHKYLAYTHGTVVEFTQEEGHVGLPGPIASALLDPTRSRSEDCVANNIPTSRTVDPSKKREDNNNDNDYAMDHVDDEDDENTPGHLAWGAFDVPAVPIEVTMVRLPKGRACRLVPTADAVKNGFYNLKDIKLVLEQSLIRTRATLSVGDTVNTWHRGIKFDLRVVDVTPATYHAVTCINTDIEVEFGQLESQQEKHHHNSTKDSSTAIAASAPQESINQGVRSVSQQVMAPIGRRLGSSSASPVEQPVEQQQTVVSKQQVDLLPEPPSEQKEGVCTVQIRAADGGQGRRRFDVHRATVRDLFSFAALAAPGETVHGFRLVTRFPRRVFTLDDENASKTMEHAGIGPGQEMFMIERL